jgi:hypothetical protein
LSVKRMKEVAVFVAVAGHVAGEAVVAVRPPESRAVVVVEWDHLFGQRRGRVRLHGEVAVEGVVHLGAVLEEKAVPLAPVADAVADHQVIGAVNGQPAVVAVMDACADHRAAAHRVAAKVVVQAVAAEHALLAQVAELGVADRAG